jgi:hypothetical protein
VRFHEAPARAPVPLRELALLVHLGMQLALQAGFVHPLEPRPGRSARELLLRSLALEESDIEPIVASLADRVNLVVDGGA